MKKNILTLSLVMLPKLLLANAEIGPATGQSMIQTFVMIGIALLFFYVILWRPEQKRRKFIDDQRKNLRKGDRVTAMGILATVDTIKENSVILRNVDGSQIEVLSAAITDVSPQEKPLDDIEIFQDNTL